LFFLYFLKDEPTRDEMQIQCKATRSRQEKQAESLKQKFDWVNENVVKKERHAIDQLCWANKSKQHSQWTLHLSNQLTIKILIVRIDDLREEDLCDLYERMCRYMEIKRNKYQGLIPFRTSINYQLNESIKYKQMVLMVNTFNLNRKKKMM